MISNLQRAINRVPRDQTLDKIVNMNVIAARRAHRIFIDDGADWLMEEVHVHAVLQARAAT